MMYNKRLKTKQSVCYFCIFTAFLLMIFNKSYGQQVIDEKRMIILKETPALFDFPGKLKRFITTIANADSADIILNKYFFATAVENTDSIHLKDYFRQYMRILLNGKEFIYINAFCKKPGYFLEAAYYNKGGGKCYFRALVDLANQRVDKLYFNAPR